MDALDAIGVPLTSNIRVILEGDEEAGSPNLESVIRSHGDLIRGDALMMVDGPRHASGRATVFFGARGIESATITVYGGYHDLHSGNYGNWAPNPALELVDAAGVDEGQPRPGHDPRLLRRRDAADAGGEDARSTRFPTSRRR